MAIVLQTIVILLGCVLLVATGLPLLHRNEWWIRACDFPRLQIAILLLLTLAASTWVLDHSRWSTRSFLLVLAVACAWQAYRIFPYTPLAHLEVRDSSLCDDAGRIRLFIANVLKDNRRAEDLLALVRKTRPDVVLAAETDSWWDEQLSALAEEFSFSVRHPRENAYGMHLLSRLPLASTTIRFLVDDDVPSIRTNIRLRSGRWIEFYGVHPRPPGPSQNTGERDAELLIVAREVRARARPAIVAGDLNDVAWSYTTRLFQRISGTLDPRIGRGPFSTFHAKYPFLRWALDHVFLEKSFALVHLQTLEYFGSDHFPVLVEVCHEPQAAKTREAPAPDEEDLQEARDEIRENAEGGGR